MWQYMRVSSVAGERIVDSKPALQRCLWTDETDSAQHSAVQSHKGAAASESLLYVNTYILYVNRYISMCSLAK